MTGFGHGARGGAGPAGRVLLALGAAVGVLAAGADARANERHFTFTHESATLASGAWEVEPWLTVHGGRRQSYAGFDYRVEFEGGLTDRLQGALYFNGGATVGGNVTGASASLELKYRVWDAVADPVGLALYLEATGSPQLAEVEAKVILDKRVGAFHLAANLVGEYDWFFLPGETQELLELQATLAAAYVVSPEFSVGLEAWSFNQFSTNPEVLTRVASVYAGPTVSYAWRGFWAALSVMPQVGAFRMASQGDFRNVDTADAVYTRLLIGLHW